MLRKIRQKLLNPVLLKEDEILEKLDFLNRYKNDEIETLQKSLFYQLGIEFAPFEVEYETSTENLDKIISHIENEWSEYGKKDTYWSVITSEDFHSKNLTAEKIERFYETGKKTLEQIEMTLRRCGEYERMKQKKCLEYGCGVGRVTCHLARVFQPVLGLDISAGHLSLAADHVNAAGIEGVSFKKISRLSELETLGSFDFIFSVIVLQHNPPPVIAQILRFFFTHLECEGIAMFQLPVQIDGYKFNVDEYLSSVTHIKGMEMHMLPQTVVLNLAEEHGCRLLEVHNDSWTGSPSRFLSQTFAFKKNKK